MNSEEKTPVRGITVPSHNNKLLEEILNRLNSDEEVQTLWKIININAIDRLGYSDHGRTHSQIVANIGLRLTRIFLKKGIELSAMKNYDFTKEQAEVIVFLACVFHDFGMSINREGHEELSMVVMNSLFPKLLDFLPTSERIIITAEAMHAILSHRRDGKPITIEAGIVRIADALDMSNGRSRIPFEAGKVNIHSLSAFAIDDIEIKEGKDRLVEIVINMNNSSGIFQIDELLKSKLKNSGIEHYFAIKAVIKEENEKKLISEFEI